MGRGGEVVTETLDRPERLGPASLDRLPAAIERPGYDRAALTIGMAHVGVGAFHRAHQAEYTDDLLRLGLDRRGVVGVNIRAPELAGTLGVNGGGKTSQVAAQMSTTLLMAS